jgi:hypothetical protein
MNPLTLLLWALSTRDAIVLIGGISLVIVAAVAVFGGGWQ